MFAFDKLEINGTYALKGHIGMYKVLGKVWPGFKNKYDLDIYDLR